MGIDDLIKQLPINQDIKLIPIKKLSSENALFWRCLVQFLQEKSNTDLLDDIIPEFCDLLDYIKAYEEMIKKDNVEFNENMTQQAILHELFEMTKSYDLSDQVKINYIKKLIEDTLKSNVADVKLIKFIVHYYEKVVPDVTARTNTLSRIISNMRISSNDSSDAKTMIKCLTIVSAMLELGSVLEVIPIIRSFFDDAIRSVYHKNCEEDLAVLRAAGNCLAINLELAKTYVSFFFTCLDSPQRLLIALDVIFNVFLSHGFPQFDVENQDNLDAISFETSLANIKNNTGVQVIMDFMDHEVLYNNKS